jgi:hypothetical protein
MTARTIAENGGENNLKKQYLKERQMKDYPEEYDQENLDNQYLAEAFPDAKGLGDLYRQTYKYTACGPWLSAEIQYTKVLETDGYGGDMPYEKEVVEWVHSDDLYSLGTWADMDSKGVLVTALMVGSIVEGVDFGTDERELEVKQLDEEPKAFAERFYKTVEEVNAEANSIWNDTHGCGTCAKHWHGEGWETGEYGRFDGNDGITPIWTDCPACQGCGVCI